MRYIDPALIDACKPANWDVNAASWLASVAAAIDKSSEFKKIGSVWSDFKPNFIARFGDKCWYTEVPRIGTDFNVDHFRPKGAVKKAKKSYATRIVLGSTVNHPGYWWLAFEASNYRYSCQYSNQPRDNGGKHDYFPLIDESTRVWASCSLLNHAVEQVQLLDPCIAADVQLVSFEKSPGMVHSRFDEKTDPEKYARVKASSLYFNLNHKTIKGARLEAIKSVQDDLMLLENIWQLPKNFRKNMQNSFDSAEDRLVNACNRKTAFSAAAVAFVRTKIAEPWMANLLNRLDLAP
ncbi:hypothetical protein AB7M22_001826 [Pseudomonas sp. ADAK2 TE3594]